MDINAFEDLEIVYIQLGLIPVKISAIINQSLEKIKFILQLSQRNKCAAK